jgi:hypothetical protein
LKNEKAKEKYMSRNSILKVLNPIIGIMMLSQILTGVFGRQIPQWAFENFHKNSGGILGILILFHIILNWNWIKANYFRKHSAVKT